MSDNKYVSEEVCAARQQLNTERMARDKERLDKTEQLLQEVTKCQIQNAEILKKHDSTLDDHETRIDAIEHRPSAMWDKVQAGLIAAAVSALSGLLLK